MHEHHRDRLRDKALTDISTLTDVELLELILFHAKPRVNTNDTAHLLIDTFGGLNGVFSADPKALAAVKGVGDKTAAYLVSLSEIIGRLDDIKKKSLPKVYSLSTLKPALIELFKDYETESFVAYFLNAKREIIGSYKVSSNLTYKVNLPLNEFAHQIALTKPKFAVITHNHISGVATPSPDDDKATEKFCMIFSLNGVQLLDHVIVAGENVFSYYYEQRLEKIQNKVNQLL